MKEDTDKIIWNEKTNLPHIWTELKWPAKVASSREGGIEEVVTRVRMRCPLVEDSIPISVEIAGSSKKMFDLAWNLVDVFQLENGDILSMPLTVAKSMIKDQISMPDAEALLFNYKKLIATIEDTQTNYEIKVEGDTFGMPTHAWVRLWEKTAFILKDGVRIKKIYVRLPSMTEVPDDEDNTNIIYSQFRFRLGLVTKIITENDNELEGSVLRSSINLKQMPLWDVLALCNLSAELDKEAELFRGLPAATNN